MLNLTFSRIKLDEKVLGKHETNHEKKTTFDTEWCENSSQKSETFHAFLFFNERINIFLSFLFITATS